MSYSVSAYWDSDITGLMSVRDARILDGDMLSSESEPEEGYDTAGGNEASDDDAGDRSTSDTDSADSVGTLRYQTHASSQTQNIHFCLTHYVLTLD